MMELSTRFVTLALLLVLATVSLKTYAAAGDPYGYFFPTEGSAKAVAVQADGKIVIAGEYYDGVTDSDMFVARINSDGTNDLTFSGDGVQRTDFGSGFDFAWDLVVQLDGKIVLGGYADSVSNNDDFALVRYNPDGSLDTGFSGGKVTTDIAGSKDNAFAIALQPDGKILLGGVAYTGSYDFAMARYNQDGTLDTGFGVNGKVTTDINGTDRAYAIAIQPDGKVLLGGQEFTNNDSALVRYNADGTIDSAFGVNGIVTTSFDESTRIWSLVVQPDGKILAGGESTITGSKFFTIVRYNADGSLDRKLALTLSHGVDFAGRDVYLQPDGKILMVGTDDAGSSSFAVVVRVSADMASFDATFIDSNNVPGFRFYTYGLADTTPKNAQAIAMRSNGDIVLAGSANLPPATAVVTRLENDNFLDFLTPHNFNFTDVADVSLSAVITSNNISINGLGGLLLESNTVPVRISDGEYAINAGSYTTDIGYATDGDQVSVRHTSSASAATSTDTTLTVGGLHAPNNLSLVLGNTTSDTFTSTTVSEINDTDNDGVPDNSDNCTLVLNAVQRDTDGDGFGNFCDADLNNSGRVNATDLAIFKTRFRSSDPDADFNGDGRVNATDLAILKTLFAKPPGPSGLVP